MKLGYCPEGTGTVFPFGMIFDENVKLRRVDDVDECDAIVLWGGTDIAPSYYGQHPHRTNQQQQGPSPRDVFEHMCMARALAKGVAIIGVCRGAQFLCAFAGGELIQHMGGHHTDHSVMVVLPEPNEKGQKHAVYQTSSCHHQGMYVKNMPEDAYEVLGWSMPRSAMYENDKGSMGDNVDELEVVYFPKVRGFAIQGHPEWMNSTDPFVEWCMLEIERRLLKETV